uniref:(northern house mosquito) hypothetical protein n=1 Tax=Culex pipiens TaxID=7175 RepID=A0A8D8AM96_CULPI
MFRISNRCLWYACIRCPYFALLLKKNNIYPPPQTYPFVSGDASWSSSSAFRLISLVFFLADSPGTFRGLPLSSSSSSGSSDFMSASITESTLLFRASFFCCCLCLPSGDDG